jgi:DNA-binding beta-propeller fold protein YncE
LHALNRLLCLCLLLPLVGCGAGARPEKVWGKQGVLPGELVKPRAIAIDKEDRVYLIDWTARIQAFDRDGLFLNRSWTTPTFSRGRPSGISIDNEGNVVVSDSHYCCVRVYTPQGKLLQTVGGDEGTEPGQFGYISDAVRDSAGNFYISEFGVNHRISKLKADGTFVAAWGSPGSGPGQFARIRAMAFGPDGLLYVADSCNHRVQAFTTEGKLVKVWGKQGSGVGELSYPYDVAFSRTGSVPYIYVVEYGNHRVQKFTLEGESKGCWGEAGRAEGKLFSPWALAVDSDGRVHVVDSGNDRVQRIDF